MDYLKFKSGTDVRGTAVNGDFTPEVAANIAAAFAFVFDCKKVAVGRDSRITGPQICDAVTDALIGCGCQVFDCGLCSTPSMFMMTQYPSIKADGAIMITASHHPYDKNGMKFFLADGGLSSAKLTSVLEAANKGERKVGSGLKFTDDYLSLYCKHIRDIILSRLPRGLNGYKIVVDAGNGAGGFFADRILRPLGADVDGSQFLEPDGMFPSHVPNPEDKAAMDSISARVIDTKADFGIIFDTDVDRNAVVTASGAELNRNRLIAAISAVLLSERQGGIIVTDSVTSDGLHKFIEAKGGEHIRYKRGYRNVIEFSQKLNAEGRYSPLAIETSGHAALKENYFLDDGAYLAVRLLIEAVKLKERNKTLEDLISDLEEPLECAEVRLKLVGDDWKEQGNKILSDLEEYAKKHFSLASDSYEGVRVNTEYGWFMARMSVHDPIIPVNIESNYRGGVKKMAEILANFLKVYLSDLSAFEKLF